MSRLQLAIDVADLNKAVDFYSRLFNTKPAKVRPGYANFAISDPPLKLALFEDTEGGCGRCRPVGTVESSSGGSYDTAEEPPVISEFCV